MITRFQLSEQSKEAHILHHRTWLYTKCFSHSACFGSSWPQETCFSVVSSGLHTATIACWADLDVCLLYGDLGEISKTQTVVWNINRLLGSLIFTVPDLHISSWLFLYSLYCISPRDCCFVTFCTIVLAGFVLHTVLKKISTLFSAFFFPSPPPRYSSHTNPHRGLSSSSSWLGCTWTLIVHF